MITAAPSAVNLKHITPPPYLMGVPNLTVERKMAAFFQRDHIFPKDRFAAPITPFGVQIWEGVDEIKSWIPPKKANEKKTRRLSDDKCDADTDTCVGRKLCFPKTR